MKLTRRGEIVVGISVAFGWLLVLGIVGWIEGL